MKSFLKRIGIYACLVLFFHHLIQTLLVNLPVNPMTKYYARYNSNYIGNLFKQNWRLFAPEPPTSSDRFWYRCKSQQWSHWKDVTHELQNRHQSERFSGYGKLVYIQEHLSRKLVNEKVKIFNRCLQKNENPCREIKIQRTEAYKKAVLIAYDLCLLSSTHAEVRGVEFKVANIKAKPYSQRKNQNYLPQITVTNYPAYEIESF